MADLEGFEERYGLNSRLVKRDGRLDRRGLPASAAATAPRFARIVRHLRAALPYATAPMRRALEALIRFYETGEDADRVAYDVAWVDDKDSPVDTINGFIENYLDARGVKGAWEGARLLREPREDAKACTGWPRPRRGSRRGCRGIRSGAARTSSASPPAPSTSSSRPAKRGR